MTLKARLQTAAARRRFGPETTAYRMVNAEGDQLPGITVDWFGGVAIVGLYKDLSAAEESALAEALQNVMRPRAIYVKRRPKEARRSALRAAELAPETPVQGEPVEELEVQESSLRFLIRPPNGLSVGLYLDARDARAWVRRHAHGRAVLNCFAYTCGFGIAAQAGGARRAVNVDLSRRVLDWGRRNARLNGQSVDDRDYVAGDVFEWLRRFAKKGEQFDLVVLDPPSFSTTKTSRFSAASGYQTLVQAAAPVISPGGTLLALCNLSVLPRARFQAQVEGGLAKAGRRFSAAESFGASPVDFPPPSALKALVYQEEIRPRTG